MEVVIAANAAEVARLSALRVARACRSATTRRGIPPVLGFATGSSPLGLYAALTAMLEDGSLDLAGAAGFALDEYIGLPKGHPESYAEVIRRTVTEPLGLDPAYVHVLDGNSDDPLDTCARFEQAIIDAGGVDVQIVGIGANGHIGFNEPGSSLASRTRPMALAERTRKDNQRFFDSLDEVPTQCLTQGLGTIMDAREIVMVAKGTNKAEAVAKMLEGPVSSSCPASVLQLHPNVTIVIDDDAASRLSTAEHHRMAWANKPEWMRWDRLNH